MTRIFFVVARFPRLLAKWGTTGKAGKPRHYTVIICLIMCWPGLALCQDSINPYSIQQHCNIILQNTDVYYNPFAPPDSNVTREQLSNQGGALSDSDGINVQWPRYQPMVHAAGETHDIALLNWQPWGQPIGQFATWQRFFQARNKPDGTHSDIIAGGGPGDSVIISKNEDVDFRASGTVKMENGFHVKPGAFFHAYQEPKWDTAVFSDEFDDTAKFRNQWHVSNGSGGNYYPEGAECVYDSNARLVTDTQAHDGHALDLIMQEDTDTCNCNILWGQTTDTCDNIPLLIGGSTITAKYIFSTGMIRSCPFPYTQRAHTPFTSAYAHQPYGKYEVREKIPHIQHHTNNWGIAFDYGFEYDMNETFISGNMGIMVPNWGHQLQHGPYQGTFSRAGDTEIFISSEPGWNPSNKPSAIVIDNVPYQVRFLPGHGYNTVSENDETFGNRWPDALADSTGPITFYYAIGNCIADTLPWKVDTASDGKWRKFSAGYHVNSGDTLHFSKTFQPSSVTLTGYDYRGVLDSLISYACHWEYNLNNPHDSGKLYLDQPMNAVEPHSGVEAYGFTMNEGGYPQPYIPFNGNDTSGGYEYHTFAMEWLPHEVRYLVDSVVVRRYPDRLVPPGDPHYDWVTTMPRGLAGIWPAETDFDGGSIADMFDTTTTAYQERKYFEHAASVPGWPGFSNVNGKPAAHYLVDYIKVWDVPKNVFIPNLPH